MGRWVNLGPIGWIVSLVVSCVLLMTASIVLGYCIYDSVQVERKHRGYKKPRKTYYRQIGSDEPLESWESVERRLIAEGKITASSVRGRSHSHAIDLW